MLTFARDDQVQSLQRYMTVHKDSFLELQQIYSNTDKTDTTDVLIQIGKSLKLYLKECLVVNH